MAASPFQLAIVVPAFKSRFLAATLRSIAAQTSQNFRVYVCDDGSPEDLRPRCENIFPLERLVYRRFEPNMGARHLVRHWNRSVQTTSEPWVWLFSDDDLMEPDCVATFLVAVPTGEDTHVYRFNTVTIDADGAVIRLNPPHPLREQPIHFAYHRFARQRESYAPEYLFRRLAWERCGGFVDLPFAQGSDDASWITFAQAGDIRLLDGPRVHWRASGANISNGGVAFVERVKGCVEFAAWAQRRFAGQSLVPAGTPCAFDLTTTIQEWILSVLLYSPVLYSPRALGELPALIHEKLGLSRRRVWQVMLAVNRRLLGRALLAPLSRLAFPRADR